MLSLICGSWVLKSKYIYIYMGVSVEGSHDTGKKRASGKRVSEHIKYDRGKEKCWVIQSRVLLLAENTPAKVTQPSVSGSSSSWQGSHRGRP